MTNMKDQKEGKKSDITTVYIADIRDELESLYQKGYSLKDIIKKGMEYVKIQETLPYNLNEISNFINDLKNENERLKESLTTLSKQNIEYRKILLKYKKLYKIMKKLLENNEKNNENKDNKNKETLLNKIKKLFFG